MMALVPFGHSSIGSEVESNFRRMEKDSENSRRNSPFKWQTNAIHCFQIMGLVYLWASLSIFFSISVCYSSAILPLTDVQTQICWEAKNYYRPSVASEPNTGTTKIVQAIKFLY